MTEPPKQPNQVEEAMTDFKSFAEVVGPWGLSYIVNTQVHLARRVFWTMVFVLGVTQSIVMIIGNAQKFYEVIDFISEEPWYQIDVIW